MRDNSGSLPPTPERLPARKGGKDGQLVDLLSPGTGNRPPFPGSCALAGRPMASGHVGVEIVVGRTVAKGWITWSETCHACGQAWLPPWWPHGSPH